jgi:hypothetical protein
LLARAGRAQASQEWSSVAPWLIFVVYFGPCHWRRQYPQVRKSKGVFPQILQVCVSISSE